MVGLEKIIAGIKEDYDNECREIIENADKRGKGIISRAEENGKSFYDSFVAEAQTEAEQIIMKQRSACEQKKKQATLGVKVDLVNATLNKLILALEELPETEYFNLVEKLIKQNAISGKCNIKMNSKDRNRLSDEQKESIADVLLSCGSECDFSDEDVDIGGGVILDYGNIEVNCSFRDVIESDSDIYKEKINEILFVGR